MVLGGLVAGIIAALFVLLTRRRLGGVAATAHAGLGWSLVAIGLVTLIPARPGTGFVPAQSRSEVCSWEFGGPSGAAFEVLGLDQRALNVVLFVPAGMFLVLAAARWRGGWLLAPLGLLGLAAYSLGIEFVQLQLARLDRACDVTDMVDNIIGAGLGFCLGLLLLPMARPWRGRERRH